MQTTVFCILEVAKLFKKKVLIVGAFGGVGKAVLSLLKNTQSGQELQTYFKNIYLLDKRSMPHLSPFEAPFSVLPPVKIENAEQLKSILVEYQITHLIDLSSLDTQACAQVCEEVKVDFLCTSVEEWPSLAPTTPTDESIAALLDPEIKKTSFRQSHLVGSGANPGIVNALAFAGIDEFKKITNVKDIKNLKLHSILITEIDTTEELNIRDGSRTEEFVMTWSPVHCLEEMFETRSFFVNSGVVQDLKHRPTEHYYKVRCGEDIIEGMVVPHEETYTLSLAIPDVDIAFVYRLPDRPRLQIEEGSSLKSFEDIPKRVLRPPYSTELRGEDRLGVLLCSEEFGELWIGYKTSVDKGLSFGTNATQLQVAAGVVAGLKQLGSVKGFHFVENLNGDEFLSSVEEILGDKVIVYDPNALCVKLSERKV